jgi:hypothetical protein
MAKSKRSAKATSPPLRPRGTADDAMERFLTENHEEIAATLEQARQSIARGEVKPLESLPTLLRHARRHAAATR